MSFVVVGDLTVDLLLDTLFIDWCQKYFSADWKLVPWNLQPVYILTASSKPCKALSVARHEYATVSAPKKRHSKVISSPVTMASYSHTIYRDEHLAGSSILQAKTLRTSGESFYVPKGIIDVALASQSTCAWQTCQKQVSISKHTIIAQTLHRPQLVVLTEVTLLDLKLDTVVYI